MKDEKEHSLVPFHKTLRLRAQHFIPEAQGLRASVHFILSCF